MATNPQAAGQTTITFQISDEDKAALQRLADASGMKLSAYIRLVLSDALAEARVYRTMPFRQAQDQQEQHMLAAEDPAPYGKGLVARVRTDFDRKVTEVSPEFIKLCGHRSEEIIGHNLSEVVQGPGTEPDAVAKLRAALAKRKSVEVEITNYHKNGQPYKISLAIKPTPEGFEGEARLVK